MGTEIKVVYGFLGLLTLLVARTAISHFADSGAAPQSAAMSSTSGPPPAQSQERTHDWYIADRDFTTCIKTDAPAKKIGFLRIGGGDASTNESRDNTGNLISVEVSAPSADGLKSTVWTYYTSLDACQSELRYRNYIPDEYR